MTEAIALTDAEKAARLRKLRQLATGVLAGLAGIYIATFLIRPAPEWIHFIRATAEAGMIGGLADWFAVEAIFRHPLGLKIPHTALLPRNQKRAAKNVATFIETHFLEPELVKEHVREVQPGRRLASILSNEAYTAAIASRAVQALRYLLTKDCPPQFRERVHDIAKMVIEGGESTKAVSQAIGRAIHQGAHGEALTHALTLIRQALDENRGAVLDLVQERSRWWIASGVDRGAAKLLVNGVISVIDELSEEDSPLRRDFEDAFGRVIEDMQDTGVINMAIDQAGRDFVASDQFAHLVDTLGGNLRAGALAELEKRPEKLEALIVRALRGFAVTFKRDKRAQAAFSDWLADMAGQIMGEIRPSIGQFITDNLSNWDPKILNERFEREVGPDLQFVRINGAILGASIGGVLFFVNRLLG